MCLSIRAWATAVHLQELEGTDCQPALALVIFSLSPVDNLKHNLQDGVWNKIGSSRNYSNIKWRK